MWGIGKGWKASPALGGALALCLLAFAPAAKAGIITPSDGADEFGANPGHCSLREAVQAAQTNGTFNGCSIGSDDDADTIRLQSGVTYELTLAGQDDANSVGDLDIVGQLGDRILSIDTTGGSGMPRAVIDGNDGAPGDAGDRLLELRGTNGADQLNSVTLAHVELTGGNSGPNSAGAISVSGFVFGLNLNGVYIHHNTASAGGAMRLNGVAASITDSRLEDNTAESFGGIYHEIGSLNVTGTTIADNTATAGGGGGYGNNNGFLTLVMANSTVTGNRAALDGGGIYSQIDHQNLPTAGSSTLTNVTIADNLADSDANGTGDGGGIMIFGPGESTIRNSIIGDNGDTSGEARDCAGTLDSQGNNLLESTAGCTVNTPQGEVTGVDPKLAYPAAIDPGGVAVPVLALLPGSPALNAGNAADPGTGAPACANTDQRAFPRSPVSTGLCDIGAYEVQALDPDGDKHWDAVDNCPAAANPGQENFDVDASGDACDLDDDNDGVPDATETGCPGGGNPLNPDSDGDGVTDDLDGFACDGDETADGDGDGVGDNGDNCPAAANPSQANSDADGLGDVCDADDDNDGVSDATDACPFQAGSGPTGCAPPPAGGGSATGTGLRAAGLKKCKRKKSKAARKKCRKKALKLPL